MILVGDSLGMVMLGYEATVRVTDGRDAPPHRGRGARHAACRWSWATCPSCRTPRRARRSRTPAASSGGRRAGGQDGGRRAQRARRSRPSVKAGIPVMGHIGWTPQSKHATGRQGPRPGQDRGPRPRAHRRRVCGPGGGRVRRRPGAGARISSRGRSPSGCASPRSASAPARAARPGPGHHGPARLDRLASAPRQGVRQSCARRSWEPSLSTWQKSPRAPSRDRSRPRHMDDAMLDEVSRPLAARPAAEQNRWPCAIPLDRDL